MGEYGNRMIPEMKNLKRKICIQYISFQNKDQSTLVLQIMKYVAMTTTAVHYV